MSRKWGKLGECLNVRTGMVLEAQDYSVWAAKSINYWREGGSEHSLDESWLSTEIFYALWSSNGRWCLEEVSPMNIWSI